VQAGQLAERKGQAQTVKDFARRMVQDHRKANNALAEIAKADRVPQADQLDEEHRVMHDQLETMSGTGFDLAYINGQIGDHQKTAQLLEWEIGSGENDQLNSYAAGTLPVVLQHLEIARNAQSALTENGPGAGAPQISEQPKSGSPEQPR
jgi:putative membrane protein